MIDHLSKELQKMYPGPPKEGDVRVYRLTGITKKKPIMVDGAQAQQGRVAYTIPNTRGLASSYLINDPYGEKKGRKSIAFVERELPTDDPEKSKQELGEIVFRQEDIGEIRISPENYESLRTTDIFLFFCPWLTNNRDKPWHIRNKLGYFIEMESQEEKSQKFIEQKDIMFDAEALVRNMEESDQDVLLVQLKQGLPNMMTAREKLEKLLRYGSSVNGAMRIISLSKDKDTILRKLIRASLEAGIIERSESGSEMLWSKGKEPICNKMPSKTIEDSMILFFATDEGTEVLAILKDVVETRKRVDSEKVQTEGTPSASGTDPAEKPKAQPRKGGKFVKKEPA
jgi:hypothetical protein